MADNRWQMADRRGACHQPSTIRYLLLALFARSARRFFAADFDELNLSLVTLALDLQLTAGVKAARSGFEILRRNGQDADQLAVVRFEFGDDVHAVSLDKQIKMAQLPPRAPSHARACD